MGFFGKLFDNKLNDTPTKTLNEISNYQNEHLNELIQILEKSDDATFLKARETVGIFQRNFTTKFKSTKSFCASSDSDRKEYLSNLASVLQKFNEADMNPQVLGLSLFSIVMYAVEMQDKQFHTEIDNKLMKLFNSR